MSEAAHHRWPDPHLERIGLQSTARTRCSNPHGEDPYQRPAVESSGDPNRRQVVRNIKNGPPLNASILHLAEAFHLKSDVTNRQHFIDDKDLRLQMGGNGEGQPNVHAAAVTLHRGVQKRLNLSKSDNLV